MKNNMDKDYHKEIMRAIGTLEGSVKMGFKGIHERQDTANGRLAKNEEKISKLEVADGKMLERISNTEKKGTLNAKEQGKWKDRLLMFVLYIIGVLIYTGLLKLGIINI